MSLSVDTVDSVDVWIIIASFPFPLYKLFVELRHASHSALVGGKIDDTVLYRETYR